MLDWLLGLVSFFATGLAIFAVAGVAFAILKYAINYARPRE